MAADGGSARRIVVVLQDFPLGGSERIAVRLANRWAELGRDVTLFCGTREGPLATMISRGVAVAEASPPLPRGRGSRQRLRQALEQHLRERSADLLFAPGNYQWPALPAFGGPRGERPAVVAQISTPLYRHGRGRLAQIEYNWRARRRLAAVDAAVALSPRTVPHADRVLGRRITQALPLPALEDDARPLQAAQGRLIVAAGRLVPEKGFDQAIRAFARLDDRTTRLAILGDGPERDMLQALAQRLGVADRVDFPGYVPDIGPWLARARLFLLSSWYEGYAAVVVEALAAGRPVVATACTPAAAELLTDPERGCVATLGDVDALAAGLRQVLSAPPADPAALARAVEGYRIGPIAQAYLDLFDEVVTTRRSGLVQQPARGAPHVQADAAGAQKAALGVDQGDGPGRGKGMQPVHIWRVGLGWLDRIAGLRLAAVRR
jgi:glycosyltransferase involved in cell wall biosynthesis